MGLVIDFEAWRSSRKLTALPDSPPVDTRTEPGLGRPIGRLETAIARLDHVVSSGRFRIDGRVEAELLAITGAVSAGRVEQATEAAERLTDRLEHPSSGLARSL